MERVPFELCSELSRACTSEPSGESAITPARERAMQPMVALTATPAAIASAVAPTSWSAS